ncbi:MAG TPA: response regulator [Myxococcota bacterium]|nr:response regulator [Myxococcota bacterium]HQK50674.1 response regulator [Myxococcota bacterium]
MTGKTVLLVDDDGDFLEAMAARLRADGFRVITAEGQVRGHEVIESGEPFDLAVLDLMMEYTDSGFVLGREVRRRRPGVPVILVTGVAAETGIEFDAATVEERRWVPAEAVLPKPVRYEQLRAEVERLLSR